MRPAILQWKVGLALFAVVLAGVTLGSVLHSSPKPLTTTLTFKISHVRVSRVFVPSRPTPRTFSALEPHRSRSALDRLRAWLDRTFRN